MAETGRRENERKAAAGDPDAEQRARVDRCRASDHCAHASTPTIQPTGCKSCPFVSWRHREEEWYCGADNKIEIASDDNYEVFDSVPSFCPLWAGPILVDLKQFEGRR